MNARQKKLLEVWFFLVALILIVTIFENEPGIVRLAFIPVVIYILINQRNSNFIEINKLTRDNIYIIINNNFYFKIIGVFYIISIIFISFFFLFTGRDLGKYINNTLNLILLFLAPLIAPIIISQIRVFRELGKE